MARVHELSSTLSDKIAAGEVIERPASVVKELLENAIDAKSTRIDIIVEEAGLKSIRVIDDGNGIDPEDVGLAFKRHATSKINSDYDLFHITTLGFRGEALPSIASVAQVTLVSAIQGKTGKKIVYKGGEFQNESDDSGRVGTDILVENLFYNTPARLKYLNSFQNELARSVDVINRIALSHPEVAINLKNEDKNILSTGGRNDLLQVVAKIYGSGNAGKMIKIAGENLDFKINGYISLPEVTRANRNYITLMINGRYVKNLQINRAIIDGYVTKLMVGRYPIAVFNIELDPILIDVNVHPTKQEVRISKISNLLELIKSTVAMELKQYDLIPEVLEKEISDNESLDVYKNNEELDIKSKFANDKNQNKSIKSDDLDENHIDKKGTLDRSEIDLFIQDKNDVKSVLSELKFIGQFQGTYVIAETLDGLYIIDQHAAQERINYEFYQRQVGQSSDDQQELLMPIHLNYAYNDYLVIQEHLDQLRVNGINLESFGKQDFIVRTHPTWFKKGQEEDILREMIFNILENPKLTASDFKEKAVIMMSCKRAIKANQHLDDQQCKALIENLVKLDNPYNCPHGRPVLIQFDNKAIQKMFKRIQDPHHSELDE